MTKVILISQSPLPASRIGSWTTLYRNYLESDHMLDFIICKKPDVDFTTVKYQYIKNDFLSRIKKRLKKQSHWTSLDALEKILENDSRYVIQVIDNFKIIPQLENFLKEKGIREKCYVQFFYHGFAPFLENSKSFFFHAIDEMIVLTNDSYKVHKEYYSELPCRFSVLHNGLDTRKFKKVSLEEKKILKEKFNVLGKTVFVWCSQDRPKKGLDLILDVWQKVYGRDKEIILWVIGSNREKTIEGVQFLGRIPNDQLPKYYQAADVYLFPTLWQEGFGLSLIEALHCGCYCIASAQGGISEVLQYGRLGKLIESPHFISEWVEAIEFYLGGNCVKYSFPLNLYTSKSWNEGMNAIIQEAIYSVNSREGNLFSK
jgi:glycosyltransferase involved in cell wall biosynthesis